jgi:hypothetical protein
MSIQPRISQMHDHKRIGYASIGVLDVTLQALAQDLVDDDDLATAAVALNVRPSTLTNYLSVDPHKSEIAVVQMMVRRYYGREGVVAKTLGALTCIAAGTVT